MAKIKFVCMATVVLAANLAAFALTPNSVAAKTQSTAVCYHYTTIHSAWFYLDVFGDTTTDYGYCAPPGMFRANANNNYTPVWEHETNVAREYGKVMVRPDGGCTASPDTSLVFDFGLPCRAHDYCYDLIRAGISSVSRYDCDVAFWWVMNAHCRHRAPVYRQLCHGDKEEYYSAVRLLGSLFARPSPGVVEIRNVSTGKCMDVEGPSLRNNTPIQQWQCVGVSNQRFKIQPVPNIAGAYYIKPQHDSSQRRCVKATPTPRQYTCSSLTSQQFYIDGIRWDDRRIGRAAIDQYYITIDPPSRSIIANCLRVPYRRTNGVDLDYPSCFATDWHRWRIANV